MCKAVWFPFGAFLAFLVWEWQWVLLLGAEPKLCLPGSAIQVSSGQTPWVSYPAKHGSGMLRLARVLCSASESTVVCSQSHFEQHF